MKHMLSLFQPRSLLINPAVHRNLVSPALRPFTINKGHNYNVDTVIIDEEAHKRILEREK